MPISTEATRRRLTLGSRNATTGWRDKEWTETTIEGIFESRGSTSIITETGTYMILNAVFHTCDGVDAGDELGPLPDGEYYEAKSIEPHRQGDSFLYRTVHLRQLPMHE